MGKALDELVNKKSEVTVITRPFKIKLTLIGFDKWEEKIHRIHGAAVAIVSLRCFYSLISKETTLMKITGWELH